MFFSSERAHILLQHQTPFFSFSDGLVFAFGQNGIVGYGRYGEMLSKYGLR